MEEFIQELKEWLKVLVVSAAFAIFINSCVIVNGAVPTGSMKNTVNEGDRILGFKFSYVFENPKRYDIIVFKYPDDPEQLFVKRIIGLPGEKVEIVDGKVYINDAKEPLLDYYTNDTPRGFYGPFYVPEDSYFVLGDNRNSSSDSKNWTNKYVDKDLILGKVLCKYFREFEFFESIAER